MRFADALHVDLGSFYARRPALGRIYRLAGYAAIVAAWWLAADVGRIAGLLVVLLIAWLMAWRREVGALFRAPLVGAIALCAIILSADRLGIGPAHAAVAVAEAAAEAAPAPAGTGRTIELRLHGDGTLAPLPTGTAP
jgi:hypothetical protein